MARLNDGKVSMTLKRVVLTGVVILMLLGAGGWARAQDQATSLGDIARQLKAERAKAAKKPAKVYSNDNLPKRPPGEAMTMASGISEDTEGQQPPAAGNAPSAGTVSGEASSGAASGAHGEKYYRARMAELRDRLETHQRQLNVLQQKQSQGQTQYYTDPNKTLQQEFSRSDANKAVDDVAKMQQQIADDQKAMDDLRDQLRHEGGEAGWLR